MITMGELTATMTEMQTGAAALASLPEASGLPRDDHPDATAAPVSGAAREPYALEMALMHAQQALIGGAAYTRKVEFDLVVTAAAERAAARYAHRLEAELAQVYCALHAANHQAWVAETALWVAETALWQAETRAWRAETTLWAAGIASRGDSLEASLSPNAD